MEEYMPEKYWDRRVEMLGDLGDGYSNREFQNYEDKLRMTKAFEILGDVAGRRILDVGCGTGRWSVEFAKRGAIVTGIDISERMIELARERAKMNKIGNIKFFNTKIEDFKCPREFDIVITVTVLQHITNGEDLKNAIYNVIMATNSGKLLIVESTNDKITDLIPDSVKLILKKSILQRTTDKNNQQQDAVNKIHEIKFIKTRNKIDWIKLFENEGAKFNKSKGVCLFGRYLFLLMKLYNINIAKETLIRISEVLDNYTDEFGFLNKYFQPKILLFDMDDP